MEKDELFKEIDLLQGCINRMAQNSFMLKGWALTVLAGVTAFTKGENFSEPITLVCGTIVPFLCFWILDAFFLHTERKYRRMYENMLAMRKNNIIDGQFELNPKKIDIGCFCKTLFSLTLSVFYGIPLIACLIVIIVKYSSHCVCI